MIFSELYGAYYNAVAKILSKALSVHVDMADIRKIAEESAFSESAVAIESAFSEDRWQLLSEGEPLVENTPSMPLTTLQKRWLKSVLLDPRIRLFDFDISGLDDVEPLFTPDNVHVFDKYSDGDNYECDRYIKNFKLILDAVKKHYPLHISMQNRNGQEVYMLVRALRLEYSEKDDKFRLITSSRHHGETVNLGRIITCKPYYGKTDRRLRLVKKPKTKEVVIELTDDRNVLERVMLHFAHFEKQAVKLDDNKYRVKINYNRDDETEIVIRVLSFGPFVRVVEPQSFVDLIMERLKMQKSCGL